MDLELTPEESRLVERLYAERASKKAQIDACLERLREARARGQARTLGQELLDAGLVRQSARLAPDPRRPAGSPRTDSRRTSSARNKARVPDEATPAPRAPSGRSSGKLPEGRTSSARKARLPDEAAPRAPSGRVGRTSSARNPARVPDELAPAVPLEDAAASDEDTGPLPAGLPTPTSRHRRAKEGSPSGRSREADSEDSSGVSSSREAAFAPVTHERGPGPYVFDVAERFDVEPEAPPEPQPEAANPGSRETAPVDAEGLSKPPAATRTRALLGAAVVVAATVAAAALARPDRWGQRPSPSPTPSGDPEISMDGIPARGDPSPAAADTGPTSSEVAARAAAERLVKLQEEAKRAEDAGEYGHALELYARLKPEVRERFAEDEKRLASLEEYRRTIADAVAAFEGARARGGEGKKELQALERLRVDPRRSSHAGRQLQQKLLELTAPGDDGQGPRADATPRPTGPSPEEQKARALARVQELEARIAREREDQRTSQAAAAERAKAASTKRPLRVELGSFVLEKAVVSEMTSRGFVLEGPNRTRIALRWGGVRPELAYEVRRLAVRDDVASGGAAAARDQFELGRFCLENHLFLEARRAFQRAVELDGKLLAKVPDTEALERASKVFHGSLERMGASELAIRYGFQDDSQGEDLEGGGWAIKNGRLETTGTGTFLALWKEVAWSGAAQVTATVATHKDAQVAVGLRLEPRSARPIEYMVSVKRDHGDVFLWERGVGAKLLDEKKGVARDAQKIVLSVQGGQVQAKIDGKLVVHGPAATDWQHAAVVVGGIGGPKNAGTAAFSSVEVRGRVRGEWLRKSFEEVEALLRGALAGIEELPVLERPEGPTPLGVPSLDPGDRASASELGPAFARLGRGEARDLAAAAAAFGKALDRAPDSAAARYGRALVLERLGQKQEALADADALLKRFPESPLALALEARVLGALGQTQRALELAEGALARAPDCAPARATRARIRFDQGDLEAALGDLDVALALDPWDEEVRGFRRNVRHVLEGPPWERTYVKETEHFRVETDISQKKCDLYASVLETMRAFFQKRFSALGQPNEASGRRAKVLVFDTAEGFHRYAELTTDDRVESLLGYYHPRYRQLLLFEDRDDASGVETLRVLQHEGFHQFIHEVIPELPFWVNEGLAEYFSTCRGGDSGQVEGEGGILPARLADLQQFLRAGGPEPFAKLMKQTPREFYEGPVAEKYAEAWSVVLFVEQGAGGRYQKVLEDYLRACVAGKSTREAYEATFGSTEATQLEAEWRGWAESLGSR